MTAAVTVGAEDDEVLENAVEKKSETPTPHPVLPPAALILVPVAALCGLFLQRRSSQPKCPRVPREIAFSVLALIAVLLYFVFPPVEADSGRSLFLLAVGLALYLGGFGFWSMRRDRPEEISILFRIAPFVGAGGVLFIGVGSAVRLEIGISLLSVGWLFAFVGCWTYAESGIRGSRSFIAGIIAAMAGPAIILQQPNLAGGILLASYCLIPLCFCLRDAGRKSKKQQQVRRFGKKGERKRLALREKTGDVEEVVVVVPRKKKPKRSRKGPSRSRSASKERPVIISRDPKAEGEEGEEEAPFFGEGVLATEPGRQGNIRLDPWTGAAVQAGGEEESSEEMESFNPEEEEAFPEIDPFGDEAVGESPDEESVDAEGEKEEDGNGDERRT